MAHTRQSNPDYGLDVRYKTVIDIRESPAYRAALLSMCPALLALDGAVRGLLPRFFFFITHKPRVE